MKYAAIILIITGLLSILGGTMMFTAKGHPPEEGNWRWRIAGREVHTNWRAIWWYTADNNGGMWRTRITLRPKFPIVRATFSSKVLRDFILRNDLAPEDDIKEWRRLSSSVDNYMYWEWPADRRP